MVERMALNDQDVLLVVDVQNDFCPGGALAVERGDEVVGVINRLGGSFPHVLMTQDWHPKEHKSFASAHPGRQPFETIEMAYGAQTLFTACGVRPAPSSIRSSICRKPS
jgi:nicotinamidase/pyrazinamidase